MLRTMLRLAFAVLLAGCPKIDLDASEPYVMVDELLAKDPATVEGRRFQVHGFVKAGSITQRVIEQKACRSFVIQQKDKQLRVVFDGPVPDTFRDQAEVVVKGRLVAVGASPLAGKLNVTLDGAQVLEATELSAKCPTNYDRNAGPRPTKFE